MTLSKAEGLINRIDAIIRFLRQLTRRAELETPLHPVDLCRPDVYRGVGIRWRCVISPSRGRW